MTRIRAIEIMAEHLILESVIDARDGLARRIVEAILQAATEECEVCAKISEQTARTIRDRCKS